MRKYFLVCSWALSCFFIKAQETSKITRELKAFRTTSKPKMDGDIKDSIWQKATYFSKFVEWRPTFGKEELHQNRTEVYLMYDNENFYIAGYCHEAKIDSISKELIGRDNVGVNDFVGVMFDTYNDKINGFGYYVTPLGEQFDAKYSSTGEDGSWSSVYETHAKIVEDGWTFEMRIPYAAIRFVAKPMQTWGINITRRRNKTGQQFMWNPTDPTFGGNFFGQFGLLTNIENIKPPIRLSFSPYLSTYANHYPLNQPGVSNWATQVNGGMDVKYGINQAFTLDMTLIPDFGQVQSDNQILNLTPFEVRFNENRNFFTEGTELFGKGNLFYSRRIGGAPINYWNVHNQLGADEEVVKNPQETKLINATKVSGRNQKGLGIGVFNALVAAQHATVRDKVKNTQREIETNPLTNYNIIVLDQSLKNSSSISFINTNVTRNGTDYDANVSAALFDIFDKKQNWNVNGKIVSSNLIGYLPNGKTETGYAHTFGFGKTGGRWNFNYWQDLSNSTYQQNDMGYFTNNNYIDNGFWTGYKWVKAGKWYNRLNVNFNTWYSRRLNPGDYQNFGLNTNFNGQLKNLWWFGVFANYNAQENDFYEPRRAGYVFKRPERMTAGFWLGSNDAKKYSASTEFSISHAKKINSTGIDLSLYQQYRFNNKLTVSLNTQLENRKNNFGFATIENDSVFVGLRKRQTITNTFVVKYNFTNMMGLNLRVRHYWSEVKYNQYQHLDKLGNVTNVNTNANANYNVNFFNVDLNYTWQFALGSFININWKNQIANFDKAVGDGYFKNLGNIIQANQANSFSIRVIYFLDYLDLKRKK